MYTQLPALFNKIPWACVCLESPDCVHMSLSCSASGARSRQRPTGVSLLPFRLEEERREGDPGEMRAAPCAVLCLDGLWSRLQKARRK